MQRLVPKRWIVILTSLFVVTVYGQNNKQWGCADEQLTQLQQKLIPRHDSLKRAGNMRLKAYIETYLRKKPLLSSPSRTLNDDSYTIPVVVHVVHPAGEAYGTGTNIPYAQIRSQLEALNAAFSRSYPSYNGQTHPDYAQDTKIRFCLARTPAPGSAVWASGPGGIEYGVRRYADNTSAYNHFISPSSAAQLLRITHPAPDYFPFENYLNIWLVQRIEDGFTMGYAPRPIVPGYPLDGIVMRADVFGDNSAGNRFSLGFGLSQGKVLAHEAGHYLNLYHIFQGGCSGSNPAGAATDACDLNGDFICDIEPSTTQNVFCSNEALNSCRANYDAGTTPLDMINDYMSYADDDCMNTFTLNQTERMQATLKLQRPTLWQTSNLAATGVLGTEGCIPPFLNAAIVTDRGVYCEAKPVTFSNPTAGNTASSYEWHFPGGNPGTGSGPAVSVIYPAAGNYKVFLTVRDGINSRTDSLSIAVVACTLDSSMRYMTHWYFGNFGSLDFSSGAPVQTTTALDHNTMQGEAAYSGQQPYVQGTVSLSDSSGNLLFYSNAVSVWNKAHQKISRAPIFGKSDINATTGISYIPYPGHPGKYFIVGVYPDLFTDAVPPRFVLVDVAANTVQPYQEMNHPSLPAKFSQFLTVVPHCNGSDFWIITKGHGHVDNRFYTFLVTKDGIDPAQTPVISDNIGHPGFGGSGNQLKANRSGNKLMLSSPHGYIDIEAGALYDFDNRTGEVKNERKIPNVPGYNNVQSGTAFSPNGEYFYIMRSSDLQYNGPPYWLFQYRVSDLKYNIIPTTGFYFAYPFQLGPDNQLYIVNGYNYLARLSNPDDWGGAVFDGEFLYFKELSDAIFVGTSLPAFIDARQPVPERPDFIIEPTTCNAFRFSSICFDSYTATWDFGDGTPRQSGQTIAHTYTKTGEFSVTLTLSRGTVTYGSTTKKVSILPLAISLTGPDTVCSNNNYPSQYFAPALAGATYKWQVENGKINGPDDLPFAAVTWAGGSVQGKLQLTVFKDSCQVRAVKSVALIPPPVITWALQDSVCLTDRFVSLRAIPAGGVFLGAGVTDTIFSPSDAGAGMHKIVYGYRNGAMCYGEAVKSIKVVSCNPPPPLPDSSPTPPIPSNARTCAESLSGARVVYNPAGNSIELLFPARLKYVQLYNIAGQRVAAGELINNKLRLPQLAAGVYMLLVFCDRNIEFRAFRFVKPN